MPMNQEALKTWAQKQISKLKTNKYKSFALMNFRTYMGEDKMTGGMEGEALQLLWARSLAYGEYQKIKSANNLGSGGFFKDDVTYYYTEGRKPLKDAPTVGRENVSGSKEVKFSGAGQCAWFMDSVGDALKPMAGLKSGELAVLGIYHAGWAHNFVIVAPDSGTLDADQVVMFDAWALAFGVEEKLCWGVKANKSWLARVWDGLSVTKVYSE